MIPGDADTSLEPPPDECELIAIVHHLKAIQAAVERLIERRRRDREREEARWDEAA
jgi:hypothetical protein